MVRGQQQGKRYVLDLLSNVTSVQLWGCFLDNRFDLKRYWIYRFEAQGALQDLLPDCDTGLDIAWRQPGKTCLTEHAESEHTHPS